MSRSLRSLSLLLVFAGLVSEVIAQGPGGNGPAPPPRKVDGGSAPPFVPGGPGPGGMEGQPGMLGPGGGKGAALADQSAAQLAAAYTASLIQRFDTDGDQALNQAELMPCLEMLYAEAQAEIARQAALLAGVSQSGGAGLPVSQSGAAQCAPGAGTTNGMPEQLIGSQPTPQGRQFRGGAGGPGGPGGGGRGGGGGGGRGGGR